MIPKGYELMVAPEAPGFTWAKELGGAAGCWLSKDKLYRVLLWRQWDERPPIAFGMMNPSTADHLNVDPTVRRCISFAKREGAGGLVVINRSPWRATLPADLEAAFRAGKDVLRSLENAEAWAVAASI